MLWYGCELQEDLGLSEDRVKSSCCAEEEQRSMFYGDAMIKIMMMRRRGLMTRLLKAAETPTLGPILDKSYEDRCLSAFSKNHTRIG